MEIPMIGYLMVSTVMFFAGVYGFITRRNMLAILISLELMLNSVDINFVVFNRYLFPQQLEGFFFTLFAVGIAAAETAIAIAIIINIYRNIRNIQVGNLDKMKIRVGKAKYKDDVTPAAIHKVDSTRMDLGRRIVERFHRIVGVR